MRIDSHVHGMHADRDETGKLCPPLRICWDSKDVTPQEYIEQSESWGVERVLLLDPPHVAFELKELFGDYVLPCPKVDMAKATPEEIDDLFKKGAVGIKFICPDKSYGDDSYFPLYDAIRANNGLAVFHTGYVLIENFEPGGVMEHEHIVDITHMRPAALDRIGRAFPDLKILMAHFGNPWWEEAWNTMAKLPNIYADMSGGTAYRRSLDMWKYLFTLDGKVDLKSFSKLCYGSDIQAFTPGENHFAGYIDFHERLYEALNIPKEIQEIVNRGNLQRLLGL